MKHYFYCGGQKANIYEVILVNTDEKDPSIVEGIAAKKAKKLGKKLVGGYFTGDNSPHDMSNYIIYKTKKGTKPLFKKKDRRLAKPIISYDELEIIDREVEYRMESGEYPDKTESEIRDEVMIDSDIFTFAYDNTRGALTDFMIEKNKGKYWLCRMKGFGWRKLDGEKYIEAENGEELLQQILPETDCTFYIYRYRGNGFKINNFHHDSPMGEWYYIIPVTANTYEKNS